MRVLHGALDSMAGFFSRLETLRKAESENRELKSRLFWTRLANDRLRLENLYLSASQAGRDQPIFEPGPHIEASIIRRKLTSFFSEYRADEGSLAQYHVVII